MEADKFIELCKNFGCGMALLSVPVAIVLWLKLQSQNEFIRGMCQEMAKLSFGYMKHVETGNSSQPMVKEIYEAVIFIKRHCAKKKDYSPHEDGDER